MQVICIFAESANFFYTLFLYLYPYPQPIYRSELIEKLIVEKKLGETNYVIINVVIN